MTSSPPQPNPPDAVANPPKTGPFAVLNVVPEGTASSNLFPGPGPEPNTVQPEPQDGSDPRIYTATTLTVSALRDPNRPAKRLLRIEKVKASVIVTDSRIAVACSSYDKGDRMQSFTLASLPITATYNAVSKLQAKKRRAGNMLVGHVRYSWLACVGFTLKTGVLSSSVLRLGMLLPGQGKAGSFLLDLTMPGTATNELARDVTRRAAHHQLGLTEWSPKERARREFLTQADVVTPSAKGYTCYFLYPIPDSLLSAYRGTALTR